MQNKEHNTKSILTIIIPHYNTPDGLKRLLETIGYFNGLEVIVVDDNSDKNVKEYEQIVKEYDNRVLFTKNTTGKKGAGAARNTGLKYATGKWVAFMDADDVVVGNLENICDNLDDSFDIIFFEPISRTTDMIHEAGRHKRYKRLVDRCVEENTICSSYALKYNFYVPWSKIIKLELIKAHNIQFEEVLYANDVMFSCRIAYYAKNIKATKETFYCITDNEFGLTKVKSKASQHIRNAQNIKRMFYLMMHVPPKYWKEVEFSFTTLICLLANQTEVVQLYKKYLKKYVT